MKENPVIIISGLPCTGKTTLGKHLSAELNLPFLNKDGIKELLFDNLNTTDKDWSSKLEEASMTLLFYFIESQIAAKKSFVVESNFVPKLDTETFIHLKNRYSFAPIQILCKTDGKILFDRFKKRDQSPERHPGHVESARYKEVENFLLHEPQEPLEIGGTVIELDTTDLSKISYEEILVRVKKLFN